MLKHYESTTDKIRDYIYHKFQNPIYKDLPRILLKLSLEDNIYYTNLKNSSREQLIQQIPYTTNSKELEENIKWILTKNNTKP